MAAIVNCLLAGPYWQMWNKNFIFTYFFSYNNISAFRMDELVARNISFGFSAFGFFFQIGNERSKHYRINTPPQGSYRVRKVACDKLCSAIDRSSTHSRNACSVWPPGWRCWCWLALHPIEMWQNLCREVFLLFQEAGSLHRFQLPVFACLQMGFLQINCFKGERTFINFLTMSIFTKGKIYLESNILSICFLTTLELCATWFFQYLWLK